MRLVGTNKVADSCDEFEQLFEAALAAESDARGERAKELRNLAGHHNSVLWSHYAASSLDGATQRQPRGIKLRLRTEFLHNALELRVALLPYVLHWTELSIRHGDECLEPSMVDTFDREVELEVVSTAPSLDRLRWYINQMADMHVAAESLHYADRYTGARLPHHLLEQMEPPLSVVESLFETAKSGADWLPRSDQRLRELADTLAKHIARLRHTA